MLESIVGSVAAEKVLLYLQNYDQGDDVACDVFCSSRCATDHVE